MFTLRIVWIYMSISVVFCAETSPLQHLPPMLKSAVSTCELESDIKLDELKSLTISQPLSHHINCFIKCILQKFDLLKEGEFAVDKANGYLDKFEDDDHKIDVETKKNIVKNCANEITAKHWRQHHSKINQEQLKKETAICLKKKYKSKGKPINYKNFNKNSIKKKNELNSTITSQPVSSMENRTQNSRENQENQAGTPDFSVLSREISDRAFDKLRFGENNDTYYYDIVHCTYCGVAYNLTDGGHPWVICCVKKYSRNVCNGIKKVIGFICDFCF